MLAFSLMVLWAASCKEINVYEKQVDLPQHEWHKSQNAVMLFDTEDSVEHQLYFVVRHTGQFPYNKLLVKLMIQDTARKTLTSMNIAAPLTDSKGNWNGTLMDDIYYSRIKIMPPVFLKPGLYRFVLQQQMKEDILPYLLNVGIALDR